MAGKFTLPPRIANQLARAAELNPRINCFTHLYSHSDVATQLDRARTRAKGKGRLDEVTVGVKDIFATADDAPTSCASRMLKNYRSPFDATVVKRLREAGAALLGKTNMDEFGMGSSTTNSIFGPTVNPSDPRSADGALESEADKRVAGGSSGGSAAAVAAGLCDIALASDTGGSTRLPASFCGIYGLKPSYGLLSRYGLVSYASSLDTVGLMGREVEGVWRAFDVMNAYDPKDPTSVPTHVRNRARKAHQPLVERLNEQRGKEKPLEGLRVGVPADLFPSALLSSPASLSPIRTYLRLLHTLGATLSPVRLPTTPLALSTYYVLASAEASSNLARFDGVRFGYRAEEAGDREGEKEGLYARTRTEGFGEEVRKRILLGTFALSAEAFDNYFLQAQRVRRLIQLDLNSLFRVPNPLHTSPSSPFHTAHSVPSASCRAEEGIDLLIHPTAFSTAPLLSSITSSAAHSTREPYIQDLLSLPASLAGLPAVSVPAGRAEDGWPVGVTVVGQWGAEEGLGRVVGAVERWKKERGEEDWVLKEE
ncbi:aspartyl-tRNA(Asn)/glutamyl-tRNA (Gln) amidotransferase subunit A [Rhodotorula toruloides]|uniref:Glutamyl-tRNA(Gln) amidotransferase subunit A, mitochondrial n=1 Tax=Rhodotorula toruloides TaxID=5286 RepID=A0A511KP70_RHOTO|nr:aspartyl-tRNA(Asn)/glutamyl-tRNA (Gln) amidotransferase subunit A [Rhodotorula toruloides]